MLCQSLIRQITSLKLVLMPLYSIATVPLPCSALEVPTHLSLHSTHVRFVEFIDVYRGDCCVPFQRINVYLKLLYHINVQYQQILSEYDPE